MPSHERALRHDDRGIWSFGRWLIFRSKREGGYTAAELVDHDAGRTREEIRARGWPWVNVRLHDLVRPDGERRAFATPTRAVRAILRFEAPRGGEVPDEAACARWWDARRAGGDAAAA